MTGCPRAAIPTGRRTAGAGPLARRRTNAIVPHARVGRKGRAVILFGSKSWERRPVGLGDQTIVWAFSRLDASPPRRGVGAMPYVFRQSRLSWPSPAVGNGGG
jgi:hypothetical protein